VKVRESKGVSNIRLCKYVSHLKLASMHMKAQFKEAKRKDAEEFIAWLNSQDYASNTVLDIMSALKRFFQNRNDNKIALKHWHNLHNASS